MARRIDYVKEMEISESLREPHFSYISNDLRSKMNMSLSILKRNSEDILLIDKYGFKIDSIFAGISEKHIEHIAKNAPRDYKDNILKLLKDQEGANEIFEIAKAIDDSLGGGTTPNQDRVRNVIQYIKDNRRAFEF